ncbi:MAG: hypothetical protein ACOYOM_15940, partial [Chloroflexota bacterium]
GLPLSRLTKASGSSRLLPLPEAEPRGRRGTRERPAGGQRETRSTHRGPGTGLAIHDMFRR